MKKSEPYVQLRNVSKTYAGITVLSEAALEVRPGSVHALVGENGAGKSTLMKILAGAEAPDPGASLVYFGEELEHASPEQTLRAGVVVIYQDLSLFPNLTVAENVCFARTRGSRVHRRGEIRAEAAEVLDSLGLAIDVDALVETLSFGQRQMIAIARAVAGRARVIVMDEPTSALSSNEVELLYRIVDDLRAQDVGIVFISHKFEEIFRVADTVTVLRDGRVVTSGPLTEHTEETLIAAMVGRTTEYVASRVEGGPGAEVLRVEGLTLDGIIENVDFVAHENEIVAITGLVGSGRTELAHTIFGITPASRGTISLDGVPVQIGSPAAALALGIGYVPEDRRGQGIFPGHSIAANISAAGLASVRGRFGGISPAREGSLARRFIEKLDVRPPLPGADAGKLSGGNQQKVLLSRWINAAPRVLIVDEPTNGIDIGAKREIHRLLQSIASQGTAVVVISSELPEVLAVANRVLIMRRGSIVAEASPDDAPETILEIELQP